jgi:hypothetical protein
MAGYRSNAAKWQYCFLAARPHLGGAEYLLAEKGAALFPVITALRRWGADNYLGGATVIHAECRTEIELLPWCPHCAREVGPSELTLLPAEAATA